MDRGHLGSEHRFDSEGAAFRDDMEVAIAGTRADVAELGRLTLDNPDLRNAMSDEMTSSWVTAVAELAADRTVRVVVVVTAPTASGAAASGPGSALVIASRAARTRSSP